MVGNLDADQIAILRYQNDRKSAGIAYALWFFLGMFGGHQFYLGHPFSGAAMFLLTVGGIIFWSAGIGIIAIGIVALCVLVDAFCIPRWVRKHNNALLDRMTRKQGANDTAGATPRLEM